MRTLDVERLADGDYDLIKPLLIELHMGEQVHYSDHPQLRREEIEDHIATVPMNFRGENVVFAVRDEIGDVIGFCWIVLFDPGTGLEGEVAEVYVAPDHRGRGVGDMLIDQPSGSSASAASPWVTSGPGQTTKQQSGCTGRRASSTTGSSC